MVKHDQFKQDRSKVKSPFKGKFYYPIYKDDLENYIAALSNGIIYNSLPHPVVIKICQPLGKFYAFNYQEHDLYITGKSLKLPHKYCFHPSKHTNHIDASKDNLGLKWEVVCLHHESNCKETPISYERAHEILNKRGEDLAQRTIEESRTKIG